MFKVVTRHAGLGRSHAQLWALPTVLRQFPLGMFLTSSPHAPNRYSPQNLRPWAIQRDQQVDTRDSTRRRWCISRYILRTPELPCNSHPPTTEQVVRLATNSINAQSTASNAFSIPRTPPFAVIWSIKLPWFHSLTSFRLQRLSHTPSTPHRHSPHSYVLSTFPHRTKQYQCNSPDLWAIQRNQRVDWTRQTCWFWYLHIER